MATVSNSRPTSHEPPATDTFPTSLTHRIRRSWTAFLVEDVLCKPFWPVSADQRRRRTVRQAEQLGIALRIPRSCCSEKENAVIPRAANLRAGHCWSRSQQASTSGPLSSGNVLSRTSPLRALVSQRCQLSLSRRTPPSDRKKPCRCS